MPSVAWSDKAREFMSRHPPTGRNTFNADARGIGFGGYGSLEEAFQVARKSWHNYAVFGNIIFLLWGDGDDYIMTNVEPGEVIRGW